MGTAPPSPQDPAAGLAYTKRLRWAEGLNVLAFFSALFAYALLGWHKRVGLFSQTLTSIFYLQVALCWIALWSVCIASTLPASLYRFHLDRKFQLENGTFRFWLLDFLKRSGLLFFFGGAIIEIAFSCGTFFPPFGWLFAALFCSLLFVAVNRSYPWILSLFCPVVPLANAALRERLTRLASRAHLTLGTLYEWRVSTRTRRANALVTGMGSARRILLTDTLISSLPEDQVEAIVAHELGHCALHHVRGRLFLQGLIFCAIFYVLNLAVVNGIVPLSGDRASWRDLTLLPGFFLYWSCAYMYGNIFLAKLARRQERAADLYSWQLIGRAEPFINAMRKITELNLIVIDKKSQWKFMYPPTADRIAAAEAFAKARGESIGDQSSPLAVNPQGS